MTQMSYQRWFVPLAMPLGLGPKRSDVSIRDDTLRVVMGWGFSAEIPLASIKDARPCQGRVFTLGVHGGWRGRLAGQRLVAGHRRVDDRPAGHGPGHGGTHEVAGADGERHRSIRTDRRVQPALNSGGLSSG